MMLAIHLLCERIVFGKCLVVTMPVTAAIRARFRLERHVDMIDASAEALEHIGEHRIVFELQIICADFDGRVPVAEVIRGPCQRERIGRTHIQHRFRRRDHADQRAIAGNEHIAVAQHRAARQHERDLFAVVECDGKTALAACIKRECERRCTLDQNGRKFDMCAQQLVDRSHVRTGNSVAPSAGLWPARRSATVHRRSPDTSRDRR